MSLLPRPKLRCTRCGQPRTELLGHVCRSNSRKPATVKLKADWGRCPRCHKPSSFLGLGHTCKGSQTVKRGDFKRRRSAWEKSSKSARTTRTGKPVHLYQFCSDKECTRPACVAYKDGLRLGYEEGIMACPLEHVS